MHFIDCDYWIKIKQRNKMYGLAFVLFSVVSSLHFLLNLNLVYLVSSSSNVRDLCPIHNKTILFSIKYLLQVLLTKFRFA